MRIAWFSPLPPVASGIASVNAALLAHIDAELAIDRFVDAPARDAARVFNAHDFVWKARRAPYDLVVYQLGNASCHDYMWAYLAAYPGLVVLHDPRLHHARARQLLQKGRADDYREEFWYDHPDAVRDVVEYAVAGLGGPIYYSWSMLRVVMRTARAVCVHNWRVAADLREEFPDARVEPIRLGTPALTAASDARSRLRAELGVGDRATLFALFGKITAEKRVAPILEAFGALLREGIDAHLLIAGDASGFTDLADRVRTSGGASRVHVTGYVDDAAIGNCLAASDACLCLRWPTALETSASWLQCLSASRATVISDLAHLVDIPSTVALRVDLLDEAASLLAAMRTLATDDRARTRLAGAGYAYWAANHTVAAMADDYRRILPLAARLPAPEVSDLPAHFVDDYSARARSIANEFASPVDILAVDDART
jgi:glycosyltransferase involved in cell wall biosynthesis